MAKSEVSISIQEIARGELECFLVGDSPLIFNSMSAKTKGGLLLPKKKTKADREQNLKHDPISEFRDSVYRSRDEREPTLLVFPATALKKALATAALETPGAAKAQVGRLTYVVGNHVAIYGIPKLLMSVVRSADMNRTPDIRSRAILSEWACAVRINYVRPTLNDQMVATLLANAGMVIGIGDFRQEKGAGDYGRFRLATDKDATLQRLMRTAARKEQVEAMESPETYDEETAALYSWFEREIKSRGRDKELRA